MNWIKSIGKDTGRAVAAFSFLVVGLIWSLIALDLREEQTRLDKAAQSDAANLALALSAQVQHTFAALDQGLKYLQADFVRDPARFSLEKSPVVAGLSPQMVAQAAHIDAHGWLVESTLTAPSRLNLADRDHFRIHQGDGDVGLYISKPVLGRVSGKWTVQLSRRLKDAKGNFAGIMVLSLNHDYLSNLFAQVNVGPRGSIVLVGSDQVVRAASDLNAGRVVGDFIVRPDQGGPMVWDGKEYVGASRKVADTGLTMLVGHARGDISAAFTDTVRNYLLAGLGVTLLLALGAALLYRQVEDQQKIARDLAANKAELANSRERLRRYVLDLERIAEVAAHDLQEPLRRVVAYAQLLSKHAEAALDQESRNYVAHVVAGAQRMRKLVKDLEAFVAVDHLAVGDAEADAGDALAGALYRLNDDVNQLDAQISSEPLPRVQVDAKSLEEVFWQLLDNALRYRQPDRRPVVHVSVKCEAGMAIFSVADNGIGIDGRHLPRLFEIFHRLHGLDQRSGTGMGLAIVRRIVEHLGGRVWVDSKPNEGSSFSFSLPMTARARLDQEVQAA